MEIGPIRNALAQGIADNFGTLIADDNADVPFTEISELNFDSLRALEFVEMVEILFDLQIDLYSDDVQTNFRDLNTLALFCKRKLDDAAVLTGA
jgi:acyl carrier protein|uniref:Acyl carrier protein n=1 Tax=Rhizobium rhizogenes TaxID=359 RepID=A0A7S5DSQ2_RHIRH|nr:hypothetical protein [Rhizobium rhizogenes]QCL09393.1 hypothetical protein pC5.7c_526 [Rhizobium rhizogenes]QCL09562.1 hypothetical protein pC5.8a_70 [Rhizobium rhizogenes]